MPVINTLIFDLGGVLYDIDVNRTTDAFRSLNISNLEQMHQSLVTENVYNNLETGSISPSEFRDAVRKYSMTQLTDDQIDDAWNALLVGFPEQRVSLLLRLKQNYQIMLLSNTNQ
ncbi:MAG TPA: HAD family phosphatase, partial [Bacteroidales bacterium]|nr:HAD family phosphatase [Bacteroidales bacterium]